MYSTEAYLSKPKIRGITEVRTLNTGAQVSLKHSNYHQLKNTRVAVETQYEPTLQATDTRVTSVLHHQTGFQKSFSDEKL